MSSRPAFRLLGFPVHVRSGFYLFMIVVVIANGASLGLWLAVFMAALTLLHELGHAVAARATGARAEISLDFLAGYASFVPTRPLKRWERAGISFAGPGIQIVVSVIALLAMGVRHITYPSGESHAIQALWWAGPAIGLFNLLPILPFDGGNIVLAGLEAVFPKNSRIVMLYASLAVTIGGGFWLLNQPRWGTIAIYAAIFPLMAQLQMLRAHRAPPSGAAAAMLAEAAAWREGDVSRFLAEQVPSPWFQAYQYLHHGDPEGARTTLIRAFSYMGTIRWMPPDAADEATLATLVALLPRPFPIGNAYAEHTLADILVRLGEYDEAAHYAADSFRRSRSPMAALAVARSAAALGDRNTAIGWLRAAESLATPDWISAALQNSPELAQLTSGPAAAGELGSR
ncbi:MAG: metalloprotease [Ilumatobacteraceae bacterium]